MSDPLLSFCIPTYNFGDYIGETLDSIISQAADDIEVVVIDGGSTDNTAAVVAEKAQQFANIRYIDVGKGRGVDRDILESVAQANGTYCWLLSSDDVLVPGAVEEIRKQLNGDWDALLVGMWICDLELKRLWEHPILTLEKPDTFDWSDDASRTTYFEKAQTTTAFFSFISDVVFRRELWDNLPESDAFVGSCWIIAAKMFDAAKSKGIAVRYLPDSLLEKRGDNDSFLSRGVAKRVELAVGGFQRVTDHFWGAGSQESAQVKRVLQYEYSLQNLLGWKVHLSRTDQFDQWPAILKLSDELYSGSTGRDRMYRFMLHNLQPWMLEAATPFARLAYRLQCALGRAPH